MGSRSIRLQAAKMSPVEITETKSQKHLLIEISFAVINLHYFFYSNRILSNQGQLKTERLHRADGAPTAHTRLMLTGTFLRFLGENLLVQNPALCHFFFLFFFFANTTAKQTAYAVSVNVCEDSVNCVTAVMVVVLEIATHEKTKQNLPV